MSDLSTLANGNKSDMSLPHTIFPLWLICWTLAVRLCVQFSRVSNFPEYPIFQILCMINVLSKICIKWPDSIWSNVIQHLMNLSYDFPVLTFPWSPYGSLGPDSRISSTASPSFAALVGQFGLINGKHPASSQFHGIPSFLSAHLVASERIYLRSEYGSHPS